MKAFTALIHREFIEHKGAFFIAPSAMVGLMFTVLGLAYVSGRLKVEEWGLVGASALPLRIFEVGFITLAFAWWLYFLGGVVFYCADSFSADRRNNAMLFWKSMPQSDLKILMSKLATATTLMPGLIFGAMLLSGVFSYVLVLIMTGAVSGGDVGGFAPAALVSYLNIAVSLLLVLAATVLWYLPFIAWIGAHSVAVGRWSIPLSFLGPLVVVVIERVFFNTSYVWDYLTARLEFPKIEDGYVQAWFLGNESFDAMAFATDLMLRIDWLQVVIGGVFALVMIYLASEYRRRTIDN